MEKIVVLDFGGQYTHLIARRIREAGVYSEILSPGTDPEDIRQDKDIKGIILSGGAASVYDDTSPSCSKELFSMSVPVLGICYGHQLIAHGMGGDVSAGESGEYGDTDLDVISDSKLLNGIESIENVWMNHKDVVQKMPEGFKVVASTAHSPVAVFESTEKDFYGVQFHPEVTHTDKGSMILRNFVLEICGCEGKWDPSNTIDDIIREAEETIGDKKAIIGLSGGVDSSTAAELVSRAIGDNLVAVYVDTGLMRYKETEFIEETFKDSKLDLRVLDESDRFFKALKGVKDPEEKRRTIGKLFIDIFEEVAEEEGAEFLVQGTIYSDRIESGITENSDNIKSHHNVGGLPERMNLQVYEPLRNLYKDEVREVAMKLGLKEELVNRQVFPGPGLAVRIIGEVTPEKAEIVRMASYILNDELKEAGLYDDMWMSFAVLLSIKSVGVQGDARSYKYPIVLRMIKSKDAMTANFARVPYDLLEKISTRITNEIKDVNRVVYDISNKPPATMEWE